MSLSLKFAGREKEIKEFLNIIETPEGNLIFILGRKGIGKSSLRDKIMNLLDSNENIFYDSTELWDFEEPEMYIRRFNDKIKGIVKTKLIPWLKSDVQKIYTFLGLSVAGIIGKLTTILKAKTISLILKDFINDLKSISDCLNNDQRIVLFIDPVESFLEPKHLDHFRYIMRNIPPKIKVVVAQRLDDILIKDLSIREDIDKTKTIGPLTRLSKNESLKAFREIINSGKLSYKNAIRIIDKYDGDPYGMSLILKILANSENIDETLNTVPETMTKTMSILYDKLDEHQSLICKVLAFTSRNVDISFLQTATELNSEEVNRLIRSPELIMILDENLIRLDSKYPYRIFHSIFTEFIKEQIDTKESNKYRQKVIKGYKDIIGKLENKDNYNDYLNEISFRFNELAGRGELRYLRKIYTKAIRRINKNETSKATKGMIYGNLGVIHKMLSEYPQALECFKTSLSLFSESGNSLGRASQLTNIGTINIELGNDSKAFDLYNKALAIYNETDSSYEKAILFNNIGLIIAQKNSFKESLSYYNDALVVFKQYRDINWIAKIYGNIGNCYLNRGNPTKALEYNRKALETLGKTGNTESKAVIMQNLGNIFLYLGEIDDSLQSFNEAYELYDGLDNNSGKVFSLNSIGMIHKIKGNFQLALEMLNKSLNIANKTGRKIEIENSYINIGNVYHRMGEFDKSIEYHIKALELAKEISDKRVEAREYGHIGTILLSIKKHSDAIHYFQKAISIQEQNGYQYDYEISNLNIGITYLDMGNIEEGIKMVTDSMNALYRIGAYQKVEETNKFLLDEFNLKVELTKR